MSTYQRLTNVIDSLIRTEGTYDSDGYSLQYDNLDELDQQKIVACYIDDDDRDLFSIYENKNCDDIVASLLTMLKNDTREANEDFTVCLKKNLTAYYAKRAQVLIDERCVEIESSQRWEHGQTKRQDRNTGESHWTTI
jgi:hypothetical protein